MSVNLKREFLSLLERDVEFRYAVAGYLGISEILKKLDELAEGQKRLWENQHKLWESQNRLWEEVRSLREELKKLWENQNKLLENQNRLWEEVKALREGQNKLWEGQNKLWEEVRSLREGQNKLWENQNKIWEEVRTLRKDQSKIWGEIRSIKITIGRICLSEEEEAWDVISYRLKNMGIDIKLERLFVNKMEINIYGANDDTCVLGETAVRLGPSLVKELERKIKLLKKKRPDTLRPKLIKVIYTLIATPQAIQKAKEYGVWILTARQDYTPLTIHTI